MINLFTKNNNTAAGAGVSRTNKANKPSFKSYVDPTGEFDSKELRYGMWYIEHKVLLYRIAVGVLAGVSALLWGVSIWKWTRYLFFDLPAWRQLERQFVQLPDYAKWHEGRSAQPLQIGGTNFLPAGTNTFNAVAEVSNPNQRFIARFDYYFVIGDYRTPPQRGFVLPQQENMVAFLGIKSSDVAGGGATLVLENVTWKRVSPHAVADVAAHQAAHLNFVVSDFVFRPARELGNGAAHAVTFKVQNATAYSYVEPKFLAGLYNNQSLVGVLRWQPAEFLTQETKTVDLRSFVSNLAVSEVKLFSQINIYEPAVYLPPPR